MIRVVIADDHHLVRQGIKALLDRADDIKIIAEAEDGHTTLKQVEALGPDVLLVDIAMPGLTGIQVTEMIKIQNLPTQVVVLSMYSDESLVRQALQNGAKGYLLKESLTEELFLAIRSAYQSKIYLSPSIAGMILDDAIATSPKPTSTDPFDLLSPREREVLKLIAEGNTNQDIADLLTISVKTVEKHRASLLDKLGIRDIPGLVRVALKHGLIFLDE